MDQHRAVRDTRPALSGLVHLSSVFVRTAHCTPSHHIAADLPDPSSDVSLVGKNLGARYAACIDQFSPRMSAAILSAMRAAHSCTESRARCA